MFHLNVTQLNWKFWYIGKWPGGRLLCSYMYKQPILLCFQCHGNKVNLMLSCCEPKTFDSMESGLQAGYSVLTVPPHKAHWWQMHCLHVLQNTLSFSWWISHLQHNPKLLLVILKCSHMYDSRKNAPRMLLWTECFIFGHSINLQIDPYHLASMLSLGGIDRKSVV